MRREAQMGQVRGVLMVVLGVWAIYRGWVIHTGSYALLGYSAGALSIAVGMWRIFRKPAQPRV